jgi:hypothetical protein
MKLKCSKDLLITRPWALERGGASMVATFIKASLTEKRLGLLARNSQCM